MLTFDSILAALAHKKSYGDEGQHYFDERHLGFKPDPPRSTAPQDPQEEPGTTA